MKEAQKRFNNASGDLQRPGLPPKGGYFNQHIDSSQRKFSQQDNLIYNKLGKTSETP